MNTANVDMPLKKISGGKSGLSLVRDAKPKLLDQLREALRARHYSRRTEQTYCSWVKRFIFFHNVRHPEEMAEPEINAFLTHLAVKEKVSASTQNQALSALLFLYRHVIGREVGNLGDVIRARKPKRLPVVMTREEVKAVLANLTGNKWLMASLMYGAGLRLMECLRLRVQDIDFACNEILVRDGKGSKDRITMLPESLKDPLQNHLKRVRAIHGKDLADRLGPRPDAERPRPQVPQRLSRLAMAMGISAGEPVDQYPNKGTRSPSHRRIPDSESRERSGHEGRIDEAGHLPYVQAFLRYSLARRRLRYPNGPRTSGPQRCQNDDDLYTCPQPWTGRRSQSRRWTLRSSRSFIMPIRIRRHDKSPQ